MTEPGPYFANWGPKDGAILRDPAGAEAAVGDRGMSEPRWEECYDRLHGAGWSIGDAAFVGPAGRVWVVSGHNGENLIRAEGATAAEAWGRAAEQARAVGMLAW